MNKFLSQHLLYILFLFISSFGFLSNAQAQMAEPDIKPDSTARVLVSAINIAGNKRTKDYIIKREMSFKTGDYLLQKNLDKTLLQSRNQVYNTNLFSDVIFENTRTSDSTIDVNIKVIERLYIYPLPQFQLADRSFNEWIKTYNANLNRVIYGLKFVHYNFSGRRDQLRISLLNGYARNIGASYSSPYSNKKLTQGFAVGAGFTQNREIGFKTTANNRIQFFRSTGFVRNSVAFSSAYNWRKGFFRNTGVGLALSYINVDDTVTKQLNPQYFNLNKSRLSYPDISFGVAYLNTNNINYPQKGLIYNYGVSKRGLGFSGGINSTTFTGSISKYIPHKNNFFSVLQTSGLIRLPFKQPYINQRAIGYGNLTLRGLEVYVVDGVAAGVAKYTLTKKLIAFNIPLPFRIKAIPVIPVKIFAKTYADLGYSYSTSQFNTMLNNKMLYTGGFGIDILTLYDIVLKVEYSFNQLGEKGLFLQTNGGF